MVLGNKLPLTAILEQDGEKVSGTVATFAGQVPASGTMAGKALKLQFTAQVQPFGEFQITMTGDLGADGFAGKAIVAGMGETDWTGKKVQ